MNAFKNIFVHKENITTDNINELLNAFARQYRKAFKNTPCEIIIVGGGSILINYAFRTKSSDIDYYTSSKMELKDVIIQIADQYNLESDWMNDDFKFSSSFSSKLSEVSKLYRSLNNGSIIIRTVKAEDLIAMKMQSGREAGNDISDIIGIIKSEKEVGNNITFETIMEKARYLYEDKLDISDSLSNRVKTYCKMSLSQLQEAYDKSTQQEIIIKQKILDLTDQENVDLNRTNVKQLGQLFEEAFQKSTNSDEIEENNIEDDDIDPMLKNGDPRWEQ